MCAKRILIIISFCLTFTLLAQELQHEAVAINVEVPVRVFDGDKFVDNLSIEDFEVYEDGVLQKIEAVYLIRKTSIRRIQEKKKFIPKTARHFCLVFEIAEYSPKLEDALNYFFQNVLVPRDNLTVVTPLKTYSMKSENLEILPKEKTVNELKDILRKDALVGNSEYRSAVKDLTGLARSLSASLSNKDELRALDAAKSVEYEGVVLDELINRYTVVLEKLENLRRVDEQRLLDFANFLQDMEGQKYVFLFYEREFIPQIEPRLLNQYLEMHQNRPDIILSLNSLFDLYQRDISFDVNRVKQAYADSSISIHFLFYAKPADHIVGIRMEEHSEDIFSAFREMALATGGSVESSANPDYLFQHAADAAENYYLVYYSPKNYTRDRKFHRIKVDVKNRNYNITHRVGYFAD